ncbi:MAG: response regulator [Cyanosarcina radialis HA8281-LM2]|jgi:signal transduction histidine kinase/DNA-binding response OmpR family regulator|nr:response regulator [Cyanosarcina radialis HA8281-LM2]
MLVPDPRLKEFIEPVPIADLDANLETILEILSSSASDRVVVVDPQHRPLGSIALKRLVIDLGAQMEEKSAKAKSPRCKKSGLTEALDRSPTQLSLNEILQRSQSKIVAPLTTVSAELKLSEFWHHLPEKLESPTAQTYALVDVEGNFLGLLDAWRLLRYLAASKSTDWQTDRSDGISNPAKPDSSFNDLKTLQPLLEQLPLPLLLQTGKNKALFPNLTWRQEIGELPEADWLKSEATNIEFSSGDRLWQLVKIPLDSSVFQRLRKGRDGEMGRWGDGERGRNRSRKSELAWLVLANDITEQQQVAKELAAKNADLTQLNRLKDEFLACVSHELKTPLTTAIGLSKLLKDRSVGELNERQARYAGLIYESGRQLVRVIDEILDLTSMETGQMALNWLPVNIIAVCDRAWEQVRQLEPIPDLSAEIPFALEIEPGLETLVADELRLRQMLIHLLSNAFKFTLSTGGAIGLKVCRWEGWIAFTVWDTGIGIPTEKQHLIFQKFQQLESPLTRQFKGIGLGLALTQRLARLHGGDISFISQEGKGSQFTLLLPPHPPFELRSAKSDEDAELKSDRPLEEETSRPSNRSPSLFPAPKSSSRLVLVVEAAPQYIEDLTAKLTNSGYWAVIARSGTEAIEKARRLQPCAILLDPLLPLLSGWDVLTILKSDAQTHHIPVIVTATLAEKETASKNQADDFLTIPVEEKALQRSLNRWQQQKPSPGNSMTILHLTSPQSLGIDRLWLGIGNASNRPSQNFATSSEVSYRAIEADDLEQADLLARVWHPDAVLIDRMNLDDPLSYLQELSYYSTLARLPILTLDRKIAEVADRVSQLRVFSWSALQSSQYPAPVLQMMQLAAGAWQKPSILVVDLAHLLDDVAGIEESGTLSSEVSKHHLPEWLQATMQYLQTAGFRSFISTSGAEVISQIQQQHVDLLLIYLEEIPPASRQWQSLAALSQLPMKPPVLVLDRRGHIGDLAKSPRRVGGSLCGSTYRPMAAELESLLQAIADRIIPVNSQSMAQLLEAIDRMLSHLCYSRC